MSEENKTEAEAIPSLAVVDPPKRGRGRPRKTAGPTAESEPPKKKQTATMPIPDKVTDLVGSIPFDAAAILYAAKKKRALNFNGPIPNDPMPVLSELAKDSRTEAIAACRVWLKDYNMEAPAWLVFLLASAAGVSAAVGHDMVLQRLEAMAVSQAGNGVPHTPPPPHDPAANVVQPGQDANPNPFN